MFCELSAAPGWLCASQMGHIACAASLQDPVDRAEAWLHCNGMQEDGGDGVAAEDRNGFGDEGEGEEAEEDEEGGWEMEVRRLAGFT